MPGRAPLLSTAEVAKWLGFSPRTICLWAECGDLPATKIGRQWRFRATDIESLLGRETSSEIHSPHLAKLLRRNSGRQGGYHADR